MLPNWEGIGVRSKSGTQDQCGVWSAKLLEVPSGSAIFLACVHRPEIDFYRGGFEIICNNSGLWTSKTI